MKRFKKTLVFVGIGLTVAVSGLVAKEDPGTKLGRGLTNIVASPGEYYVQTAELNGKYDAMTMLFSGFFKGTYAMIQRIGVGVYDVLTFPIPWPAGYQPVMQPATVVDAINQQYSKTNDL